jgi:transcriptional regulator GlxA family with amidase domain
MNIRTHRRALKEAAVLQAARRLLDSNDALKQIQSDCGYGHRGSFIRLFREIIGTPPSQWRRHGTHDVLNQIERRHNPRG